MKDNRISRLFDNYAEELPQQTNLADAARQRMSGKSTAKNRPSVWSRLGAVCCALIVLVLCVSVVKVITASDNDKNNYDVPSQRVCYYSFTDLTGKRLAAINTVADNLTVADVFSVESLSNSLTSSDENGVLLGARFAAYYFDDGSLACVIATYRVYVDGDFADVEVLAEKEGFVEERYAAAYRNFSSGNGGVYCNYVDGEVVSLAYASSHGFHFYVTALNADSDVSRFVCEKVRSVL